MNDSKTHQPFSNVLEGMMTEEEFASECNVTVRTCQRARQLRQSPPYIVVGKKIYYRASAVKDWLLNREGNSPPVPPAPLKRKV